MAKTQPAEFSIASSPTSAPEARFDCKGNIIRINFRPSGPWKNREDDDSVTKIQQLASISKKSHFRDWLLPAWHFHLGDKKAIQNRITKMRDAINSGLDGGSNKYNQIMDVQFTAHMSKWSTRTMECFLLFETWVQDEISISLKVVELLGFV